MTEVACVQQANAFIGEGPVWHPEDQRLYWLDVDANRPTIYAYEPGKGQVGIWPLPSECGFIAPKRGGGLVASTRNEGIVAVDLETGTLRHLAMPAIGRAPGRVNDGRVDPRGRLWVGWLTDSRVMPGAIFRFDPDGTLHKKIDDVTASNGMGWSTDGRTFYYTDSTIGRIWRANFDLENGTVGERKVLLQLDVSRETPDGLQVDAEDHIWTAVYRGGRLIRISPEGRIVREIPLPVTLTTSCAFGGADLSTLYVTSGIRQQSRAELSDQPQAGGLFALDPGVKGLPFVPFVI